MDFKKIKSLEAALKVKGLTMAIIAAMFANVPEEDRQEQILAYALNKGEDVINGDEKLDWTNTDQPKYWIWWDIVKKASGGFGLSLNDVNYDNTNANVRAHLCLTISDTDLANTQKITIKTCTSSGVISLPAPKVRAMASARSISTS